MSSSHHDVIVAGAGSMGSAACFFLARRGYSVLGLEQFDTTPHVFGSHAGQSRIIRKAYFEHPGYVPLLERAYTNWRELEELTGERVYHQTGLLYCGPREHEVIKGVKEAAKKYAVDITPVSDKQDHPFFNCDGNDEMLLEPDAGFLLPEKAITLYIREAIANGAVIRTGEKLVHWEKKNGIIHVRTAKRTYTAKKLIITAGAWAAETIRKLTVPLKVTRQLILWVEPDDISRFLPKNFPCWMLAGNNFKGVWYGFPYLSGDDFPGPAGLKFALHHAEDETDPDKVNREITAEEIRQIVEKAKEYFSFADSRLIAARTCLYSNSPDEHFIIDRLPGLDGDVVIACGFSGHGFKFVSVVGELLAELAMKGKSSLPADFLGLGRFG